MGTPKKREVRQLESPTIAEKIRLLEIGKETGKKLNLKMLPNVLEEVRIIILPLVSQLDKPLFTAQSGDHGCPPPRIFQNMRAMKLFDSSFIDIWLERSGRWFVWVRNIEGGINYQYLKADSKGLAEIILQKSNDFIEKSLRYRDLLNEVDILKEIVLFNTLVIWLPSQFIEYVNILIEEREAKIRIMKKRTDLAEDFIKSLDPLISQDKEISLKAFSISSHHGSHMSRATGDYFCPEALSVFWEYIIKSHPWSSEYKRDDGKLHLDSLEKFIQRMIFIFEEIKRAKSAGRTDAKSIFSYNSGRLPLSEAELKVIKEAVESITT